MTTVDKSRSPYFDDFSEEKNFHEVLFVPSRAVQVRELNQIQSMFAEQIKRFGDHVFEEGSMVIPGEHNYDLNYEYVKVDIPTFSTIQDLLQNQGLVLRGESGIEANVKQFVAPEGTDPSTFYIEYLSSSTDYEQSRFATNELIEIILNENVIGECDTISTGKGSKFTINSGVYYLGGRFVAVEGQTILLDKYSVTPSKVVGIEFNEVVVTENEDSTLFDNAQGTPNFTAPGAHRLRIDTNLVSYDLADIDSIPENVAEIFRIENGSVQKSARLPEYAVLNDVLATRTYEESGDYTVRSFNVSFSEHDEVYETEDDSKFVVGIEEGLAYVRGYRVENLSTQYIPVDKARDTDILNNSSISANLGYYITVNNLNTLPNTSILQKISFYDSVVSTPGVEPTGNVLGSARIRCIRKDGSSYRLYIFDVKDNTNQRTTAFISNALSVYSSEGTNITADLVDFEIKDALSNSLVFPFNVKYVKSLRDSLGNTDTSYSTTKVYNQTTDTNGVVTLSASTNEVFVAQDSTTWAIACFTDTDEFVSIDGAYSLGGNPVGSVITYDFGAVNAGRPIRIFAQVAKEQVSQKTKTKDVGVTTGSLTNGVLSLGKADVIRIVSVVDSSSNDITSQFTLSVNKTQSYYGVSYITGPTSGVAEPITVEFEFFRHSSGDYFGPDSYAGIPYEDIPYENSVRMTDMLDFRPRISDDGNSFSGTGSIVGNIPTPYSIIRADIEYYLPRKDKIYVTSSGVFNVLKGTPALEPAAPEDPSDSLVLYEMDVPAYTFDLKDIRARKLNNRRYTMKDIGALEKRIANVEYYVSLNLLEQEADAKQIIDPTTGLNRFKNGFLTDSFVDHSVGNYVWSGYHVSMDGETGTMRPEFSMNAVDLEVDNLNTSNVVVTGGIATLPYTSRSFIKQMNRSETMNVNPYAVFRWEGAVVMNPSVDSWIDTVYTEPEVTYRVFNNGKLTQTWKSWGLNWTGGTVTSVDNRFTVTTPPHSEWQSGDSTEPGAWTHGSWANGGWRRSTRTFVTETTTKTNIDVINDKLIDTSVIPYMRSIDIELDGVGHRPLSKMNFFFDGKKVNQYVRPKTGTFGQSVLTNVDGEFEAIFRIPNDSNMKFRTGQKVLVVTDEANGVRELSTSWGEQIFTSTGIRNVRRQTIIATRNSTTTTRQTSVRWHDPLAQSFLVEREGGVFVTKIDVFFATKDPNIPVTVEIREMENGAPTQNVVPGASKTLHPKDVSLSADGSIATSFEFPYPIYLMNGAEYCFVVWTNSNRYNVWIARMGKQDKGTGKFIVEQPYAGVLFKSQNNSTWTADQTADLQFEIHTAKFDTSVAGNLSLINKDLPKILMPSNPIETVSGSDIVYLHKPLHNYIVGGSLEIIGATGGNGVVAADLNKTHTIVDVTNPQRVGIQISAPATVSGFIGGDGVLVSNTIQASLLHPNIPVMQISGTQIDMAYRGTIGRSIDGNEAAYSKMSEFVRISNESINNLRTPLLITNRDDEANNLLGQHSLEFNISLQSDNDNVSPVIDTQGMSVITPNIMINSNQSIELDGSNNWANYVTQVTGLVNPANSIRVYMDTYKPSGADIILSVRVGNSQEELMDSEWIRIDPIVEQTSGDFDEFLENEYGVENLQEFTLYQIMIQLKSTSSVNYPMCRRLRAIALGT